MSLAEEASRSVQAAWGLLRRDPAAPQAFNATVEGFWRSFAAALFLLPLFIAYRSYAGPTPETENAAPVTRWAVVLLVYGISWVLWPLIAFYLTRALGVGERFLGYMVAYNWAQLLTGPFIIGVSMAAKAGMDAEIAGIFSIAAVFAALFYEYLIARQMLGVPPARAALLVFAALATSEMLNAFAEVALALSAGEAP